MVQLNENEVEINDVDYDSPVTAVAGDNEKETVMNKIKAFGTKHKTALAVVGGIALAAGAIIVKVMVSRGNEIDLDDATEDTIEDSPSE